MNSTPYTGFSTPKYIEPTICFTTDKIKIGENYPLEKLPVTEFADVDQVLVEFTDTDLSETDKLLRRSVVAGTNTYLSEDTNQVLACVAGYPRIDFCSVDESEEKAFYVSVEPLFHLSHDRMEASINVRPVLYNYNTLSSEDLYQLLVRSGIVFGIEYKQLHVVKNCIRSKSTDTDRILVARGKEAIAGTNAYLKFQLEIGPIAGKLLLDGSIDFRERKIMVPVSAGQIIATKVPATKGTPGSTVLGELLEPQPGLDIEVKTSNDAVYLPEKLEISATRDGVLSIVNDNVIMVCSRQLISGNIDYSTGNIESKNSVVINGSVFPAFQVKTQGDLEIKGSVMSAQVSSQANIVIHGGIIGISSSILASGDIDIFFVEQGQIRCNGNCIIRKQCYYSYISAGGNIRCKENSTLVGGELVCEGSISLGDAGTTGADPAFIAAGVVAERLYIYRKLKQRLEEYKASIIQRLRGYTGTDRAKKLRSLKTGIKKMKLQQLRINMIPGTSLYSSSPDEANTPQNNLSGRKGADISCIFIDVHGTIFAGTLLQIGNRTLKVEHTIAKRRFKLDPTKSHILTIPLP
jgi:uncharacterized protein (DUF342 family)